MKNWDSAANNDIKGNPNLNDEICQQEKDFQDAKLVAQKLKIKINKVDFVEEYWNKVFSYFIEEYRQNRTPNPDILCNNEIKFKAFLDYALKTNADYIAMGHYARLEKINGKPVLLKGFDDNKDQSYFLAQLEEKQLEKVLFPIGNLKKEEVRKIANNLNLKVANKKDSTGICFIGERKFNEFLSNYLPSKKGDMRRLNGDFIKNHFGLMNYTIGQRKGLGIGGSKVEHDAWYVVGKDLKTNTLFVEPDKNHPNLFSNKAVIKNIKWRGAKKDGKMMGKFRYRQKDVEINLTWISDNSAIVEYNDLKAITPGQAAVFYDNDICLGSGFIEKVYYNEILRIYS